MKSFIVYCGVVIGTTPYLSEVGQNLMTKYGRKTVDHIDRTPSSTYLYVS